MAVKPAPTRRHSAPLKIGDIMTPRPVCVERDATVAELAETFDANDISGAPVIDDQERVIGVVSKTDLIRQCVSGPLGRTGDLGEFLALAADPHAREADELGVVEDFMTPVPITAAIDESLASVARRMAEERVHRVIVVDEAGRAVGIATALDLLGSWPARAS